ncbi:hypothetical protein, partial [Roseburia sp. AF20-18LB]|uniref:hypothetical protein n=1 Tax=Roseburia sp. AF20-18LB TaxID=2293129 RepID=UPI000E9636DB
LKLANWKLGFQFSLKRQTLKKIKKTTNNIKIINQNYTKNKYKACFDLKLFTFWSKSASLGQNQKTKNKN